MNLKHIFFCFLGIFIGIHLSGQTGDTVEGGPPKSSAFAFGGEFRSRVRTFKSINYGDVVPPQNDYDTYLNLRGILFGNLDIGKSFTLYGELLSGYTLYKDKTSSSDIDLLGFSQLFAEARLKRVPLSFRIGRQGLDYGSGKILGTSDGPNVSTNFDGFRLSYSGAKITGDLMAVRPVRLESGFMDNAVGKETLIYGGYFTFAAPKQVKLDLYAFGNHRDQVTFLDQVAHEKRYTLGSRISKEEGALIFESEFAWQTGTFGTKKISAFYLSGLAGYTWDSRFKPALLIRGALYSGKKDSTDQVMRVFRPVYSRPPINSMSPIGSSNIFVLVPQLDLEIRKKVSLSARYFIIWRISQEDGLYSTRLEELSRDPDSAGEKRGMFVTNGLIAQAEYDVTDHIAVELTTGWFFAGEYIRNTGQGKNVQATFLAAYYRF